MSKKEILIIIKLAFLASLFTIVLNVCLGYLPYWLEDLSCLMSMPAIIVGKLIFSFSSFFYSDSAASLGYEWLICYFISIPISWFLIIFVIWRVIKLIKKKRV